MSETIERKVAEAVLQLENTITVGDETFVVAPPSTGTIIMVSEAVSRLPEFNIETDNVFTEALSVAKECEALGDIGAILIMGAKSIKEDVQYQIRSSFFKRKKTISMRKHISDKLILEMAPSTLRETIISLLKMSQVSDFFAITASLIEINLLRQTRGAVTTASGQPSRES